MVCPRVLACLLEDHDTSGRDATSSTTFPPTSRRVLSGSDGQYTTARYVDRGDVADNPAWRCTETQCSYSVQQRGRLRSDDDRPGWPRSDVLVSPHVLMAWVCGAVEGMLSGRGFRGW